MRSKAGSGGAAAGQNFETADRCPVTETSVFYKFLQGVERVVAALLETLLSLSLFHRFRIPPDNFDFPHDSVPRTSTGMRSSTSIGRHFRSNGSAIRRSSSCDLMQSSSLAQVFHGFDSIDHEIHENLLQLNAVGCDFGKPLGQLTIDRDRVARRLAVAAVSLTMWTQAACRKASLQLLGFL